MSTPKIDSQPHTVNALIKRGGGPGPTKPGNQSGEPSKSRFSPDMVPSPTLPAAGKDESGFAELLTPRGVFCCLPPERTHEGRKSMFGWPDYLCDDPTDWLLEEDNPSVRYLALRTIMEEPEEHRETVSARLSIMRSGPVPTILAAQHEDGYWVKPGAGYRPKYQGTVWQLMFLAHLAADGSDGRGGKGCENVLPHSRGKN